jgi:hypothetical protein
VSASSCPETAPRVAETRRQRCQADSALQRFEAVRNAPPPPPGPSSVDNPRLQRLAPSEIERGGATLEMIETNSGQSQK